MRGEVRGVKGEAIGAPFHDVCDDAGREPLRPDALRSFIPHAATGFSRTGYVTATEMVIHPRRSRVARTPLKKIVERPMMVPALTEGSRLFLRVVWMD